jgi:hypothetical protein
VTLLDAAGKPIYMYPSQDLWLETSLGGLITCNGGAAADRSTNAAGVTLFTLPIRGGKCSNRDAGETTRVLVNGTPLVGSDMNILFNSPDINGDLIVDFSDVWLFNTSYFGAYAYGADLYYDNVVNLKDLVLLCRGLGGTCP